VCSQQVEYPQLLFEHISVRRTGSFEEIKSTRKAVSVQLNVSRMISLAAKGLCSYVQCVTIKDNEMNEDARHISGLANSVI
jgi:hypothetical protein